MLAQFSHASLRAAPQMLPSTNTSITSQSDTQASIQQYMARRSFAFDLAEDAYWENLISADAYMLYRLLVRLCKDRTYCWPGLDYLAKRMHTSVGTIKRRLNELEAGQLIARKQRAGGYTSYTYVCPLQQYDEHNSSSIKVSDATASGNPAHDQCGESGIYNAATAHDAAVSANGVSPLFFVPEQQINYKQSDRSMLISQSIKSQNTNIGGGRLVEPANQEVNTDAVTHLLQQAGVLSHSVLEELKLTPVREVEVCIEFARRQQQIIDPAAFAVSLIRLGLASKLASSLHANKKNKALYSSKTKQASKASYADKLAQTAVVDRPQIATMSSELSDLQQQVPLASTIMEPQNIWLVALRHLEQQLPQSELTTWLGETALVDIVDNDAVLAVPNIFARDMIEAHYIDMICSALQEIVGRQVKLHVIIE